MLLNNTKINKEIVMEVRKYFQLNDDKNITYQNLYDLARVELEVRKLAP